MNREATAAIAELLGALGVIPSLIYLANQVRSSGNRARQAAIQSVANKMNTIYQHQAANPDHASLWVRGARALAQWTLRSDWFSTEFRAHVEGILEEAPDYRRFDASTVEASQ